MGKKACKFVLTGGHLSPLLSVLDVLSKNHQVLVIGRKYSFEGDKVLSLEYQTLKERSILFKEISAGRLQRKLTRYTLLSLFKFPAGFFQSLSILNNYKPDAVISFGGYVSLPVVFAAFVLNIPIVIHEQTFGAGFSNKLASFLAKKVCISWESSSKFFPKKKTILTGNPVRKMSNVKYQISNEDGLPLIYITGGSSGSHAINLLVEGCIEELLKKYLVFHQTGDSQEHKDFDRLLELKSKLDKSLQERYQITKFVDPALIGSLIEQSDLVISRSGMNTVTELLYYNKPSFLIPLPYSGRNEQMENATFFKNLGLGEIGLQNKLTPGKLPEKINLMFKNLNKYKSVRSRNLIREDASEKIASVALLSAKNGKNKGKKKTQ